MRQFLLALLVWPTLYHFALSADSQRNEQVNPEWYVDRIKRWDSLLKQAGQNWKGLVLEARIVDDSQGLPSTILLGVRNVGDAPISTVWGAGDENPILLIRDGANKPVLLTRKGEKYHDPVLNSMQCGSSAAIKTTPGAVRCGRSIPLHEHFVIDHPGRYTVLATKAEAGGELVAKPVTFEFVAPAPLKAKQEAESAKPKESTVGAIGEWATLEAKAGLSQRKYVLEADVSPINPTAMNLIVSLISLGYYDQDGIDFDATDPHKYRILMRGPDGKLRAVDERARTEFVVEEKNLPQGCNVGAGYGNGSVLPLAKWYDMTAPGQYTVLVALPFTRDKECFCVAKPVKINVAKLPPGESK